MCPSRKKATQHPSVALGISAIRVGLDGGRVKAVSEVVEAITEDGKLVLGAYGLEA